MQQCHDIAREALCGGHLSGSRKYQVKRSWIDLWCAGLLLAAAAGFHLAWAAELAATPAKDSPLDPVAVFLARHWPDPLLPQGNPPEKFSALEASLDPRSCGKCHVQQFLDWQSSLHSKTMGPGIRWQFAVMDQKRSNECLRCHAPLAEQKALLAVQMRWAHVPDMPPPAYVAPDLHLEGLVCAACHVRRHVRFGPPPGSGSPSGRELKLPHGGFTANAAFQDSRFCAVCHQFPADGPNLNGKLLENTFVEWRASAASREGKSCQSCHMAGGRHLWRGIHDANMVRKALSVSLEVRRRGKATVWAQARLANIGAGHYFPTYVVPEVVASLRLVDADGHIRKELAREVIGRQVDLSLTKEIADTRIAPGGHLLFGGPFPAPEATGWKVELQVVVYPSKHYERLFRSVLEKKDRLPLGAAPLLREALAQIEGHGYKLYLLSRPVPPS